MHKFGRGRGIGYGWYGYPGFGRGNPYPFCRWFPWLPRWWWSGMYGPISPWTGYGIYGYPGQYMSYQTPYRGIY